jgi:hypothetical protein
LSVVSCQLLVKLTLAQLDFADNGELRTDLCLLFNYVRRFLDRARKAL